MKKTLALVMTMVLLISLFAGCSNNESATPTPSRGGWEGDTYSNEYLNLHFTLLPGWTAATEEQLAELMGTTRELLPSINQEYPASLLDEIAIYDTMLYSSAGSSLFIMYQNLALIPGGQHLTEKELAEFMGSSLSGASSINYSIGEVDTLSLSGETFTYFIASAIDHNISQYYCLRKIDDYMVGVVFTITEGDSWEEVLASFN